MADSLIVLDTHAVLWWSHQPEKLGRGAKRTIEAAERIGLPAIVFWETALLVRKKRLALGAGVANWAAALMKIPRVEILDLTAEIALAADALSMHDDPADRFIVATAAAHRAPLVTRDQLLRGLQIVHTVW